MWPFTRKTSKPPETGPGPINEDWKTGDLAECIHQGFWISFSGIAHNHGPEFGDVLKVQDVEETVCFYGPVWCLRFFKTGPARYDSRAFRKVPPISEEEAAKFAAKIKTFTPKHEDVTV